MTIPAALRRREFRSLWLAGLVSDAGDWMLLVALPIVVYQLTGSALGTSVAFLLEMIAGIVLAPLAGRLADRVDRRRLLLVVSALQAVGLLPLLLVDGRSDVPIVYAVIFGEAALAAFFDPAKNALLPALLPAEELVQANSLVGLNQNLGRLAGGPLGGLLLAAGDLRVIVLADALSYLAAAVLIARVRVHGGRTSEPAAGGFLIALRDRGLRRQLLVVYVGQIAQGIFVVLFVVFVARRLHGDAAETGLLRGIQAVGAIAAGLALAGPARTCSPRALTAAGATAFGALSLTIWNASFVTTAAPPYVVLFVLVGAPGVLFLTGLISGVQLTTAPDRQGRAFGALGLASAAGQATGMLAAGVLAGPVGLLPVLEVQGALYLLAGMLALWPRRDDLALTPAMAGSSARSSVAE